ncbi:MAG: hypothetical protein DRP68_03575 [Candidatus Omnitrophota bacterium]|nr:MAG: hypothetical protein DRP68_03575 [Candidatus Omnitrophota bacterium]RKY38888.1 MAG: hypothetical protein DRP72_00945 [Candidatus Omnitrophota bacterium]
MFRKLNILMVNDIIFPDVKGGSGRVVRELSKSLIRKGHNISVLVRRASEILPLREKEEIEICRYSVNYRNNLTFFISSLKNVYVTFNHISKGRKFDLIIFHHPLPALGISLIRRIRKIPKIYIFHSSWPEEFEVKSKKRGVGFFLRRWIERKILKDCSKIVVLSNYSKQKLLDLYGSLRLKVEIIPGGVDIERFKPSDNKNDVRIKLGIPIDKFTLLTIRNLTVRMGLENLIKAMVKVTERYKDILLIIGGRGILESKLKTLTKELGLERYIKFVGLIDEKVLPLYYQAADVFILPSKCLEGFGLVTLEALATGVPVLGTPVGGTIEILRRLDEKFLFKGIDVDSIANLIIESISDADIREGKLREKCRKFVVENYSWERSASELEKVLFSVLNVK